MKAIYQTQTGKSDVLQFGEQDSPRLKANQIRIENHAASVNPRDWMIRSGRYQLQFLVPAYPLILGSDFAGKVVEVGRDVTRFKLGERVFGMKNPYRGLATYAEEVVAAEKNMAHMPKDFSYEQAAGMPLCALTAWQALVNQAQIQAGMKVLVIGASGGVGTYAVQIAKALGAEVTGVCSEVNHSMVSLLGARELIDYRESDFTKGEAQFDIVFDCIGRHSLERCAAILNPGGCYVSTIPSPKNFFAAAKSGLKSIFVRSTQKAKVVMVKPVSEDLARLSGMADKGQIEAVIDRVFPLEEAAAAHDHSRSLRAKGKIILKIR